MPAANPVARQMEQLASELNTPPASPEEAYILGGAGAPEVAPQPAAHYPATETLRATTEMPLAPQRPEPGRKSSWGFFGRKKTAQDLRQEPRPEMRQPSRQPLPPGVSTLPQPAPEPTSHEDLFPEHGRDDQFEIPAFLRRQSN
jgi:hypothetical protein